MTVCLNLVETICNARVHTFIMYSSVVNLFRAGSAFLLCYQYLKNANFPLGLWMLSYALEVLTNDSNPSYQVYCRINNISQSAWSLSFLFAFLFLFLFLAFVMTWNTQKSAMDQAKALQTDWSWQLPSKALKMRPKYWWLTQIDIEAESSLLLTCLAWI